MSVFLVYIFIAILVYLSDFKLITGRMFIML